MCAYLIMATGFNPPPPFMDTSGKMKFKKRYQMAGESVDEYIMSLRENIDQCKFDDPDDALRDQFLEKTTIHGITEKLLQVNGDSKLTFDMVLDYAKLIEQAREGSKIVLEDASTSWQ